MPLNRRTFFARAATAIAALTTGSLVKSAPADCVPWSTISATLRFPPDDCCFQTPGKWKAILGDFEYDAEFDCSGMLVVDPTTRRRVSPPLRPGDMVYWDLDGTPIPFHRTG